MNIILKSFLITLALMIVILMIALISILPSWYGLVAITVTAFGLMWFYIWFLLK